MLAAWSLIVTAALGGIAGIVAAWSGAKKRDLDTVRATIVEEIQRENRRQLQRRDARLLRMIEYNASLACQLNRGAPHQSYPCGSVQHWYGPPLGHDTPLFVTAKPWPQND